MSDSEQAPPDELDQLFAVPGSTPVPPAEPTHSLVLPSPQAGPPATQKTHEQTISFQEVLEKLTPVMWVTPALLVLNVGYYAFLISRGVDPWLPDPRQLLAWGADYAPLTWTGQPWRLLTSVFIHFGVIHLGVNMWALWSVGRVLERLVGNVGYLIIYFASGIAGSLSSLWWNGDVVSVGASGAIFGLFGAFATFIWNRADSFPPATLSHLRGSLAKCIVINLLLGAGIQGIDQAAHVGGLLCGLICGLILSQPLNRFTGQRRWKRNLITGAVATLTLGIMIIQHPPAPPDLFMELTIYEEVVPQTIDKFNTELLKFGKRQITSQQLVDFVQKEILPPWKRVQDHVDQLKNIPASRRELLHQIRQQLLVREESWQLMIEALQKNDAQKFAEFQDKWKQANHLRKQLESPE